MAHLAHSRGIGYCTIAETPKLFKMTSSKIQDGASSLGRLRVIFGSCSDHIRNHNMWMKGSAHTCGIVSPCAVRMRKVLRIRRSKTCAKTFFKLYNKQYFIVLPFYKVNYILKLNALQSS